MQLKTTRSIWMILTALTVFAFSAVRTAPAYADDTAPPPEETPLVEEPTTQVPEGTDLVVVDESGNAVPLATQDAADAIVEKDPMWCPTGVAPKASTGGCSASFGNLNSLVTTFVPPAKNGTIWIEAGTDSQVGGNVLINGGGTWSPAANFSLTLQGGWNNIPLSKAIIGTSLFDSAINIVSWNGAVNVYDIAIVGAANTYAPSSGAINIATTKSITLGNVLVANTTGGSSDGIYLTNTSSTTQAPVTIKNSSSNGNIYRGITVYSDGAITLTNVTANNNTSRGAYIDNSYDTAASLITISNSTFSEGSSDGLVIVSNGVVKLNQVTANNNGSDGVNIDNSFATANLGVTVTGFLTASSNSGTGLFIQKSKGAVSLINLTTNLNGGRGTQINNTYGTAPAAVTISGANVFNDNAGSGLVVNSNGAITINNITAISNNANGVELHNATSTAPAAITISGTNIFNDSFGSGLIVDSIGAITTNNITAISNNSSGVELHNISGSVIVAVKMNGTNFFENNDDYGLWIESLGAITTNNLTVLSNGNGASDSPGAYIYNNYDPAKASSITMNGTNVFNDNSRHGLQLYSYGVITTNNISAAFNGADVVDANGDGVLIDNSGSLTPKAVILKGANFFNENEYTGLEISSIGAITVSNITSYFNTDGWGVYLDNASAFQASILITGYGLFEQNEQDGLYVISNGSITTMNLTANQNNGNGVNLNTIGFTKPQAVTMKGNNSFVGNGNVSGNGLVVMSDGNITVNNLRADNNVTNGALLDNFTNWDLPVTNFATFGSIVLTGFNSFMYNGTDGVHAVTHGTLVLNNVTSSYNGDDGIHIDADGKVTLVCAITANNTYGVYMYGTPAPTPLLTIKGLLSYGNTNTNEHLIFTAISRTSCP